MYYKKRKMESEKSNQSQSIVNRVSKIPLVKAVRDRAVQAYEATKNHNRLFNSALGLAENFVKQIAQMETVKKVLDGPVVVTANKIAVGQIDQIQRKYPIVNITPDELWKTGKNYYEHSRVKENVEKVYAVKEYGVSKIEGAKQYFLGLLLAITSSSQQRIGDILHFGASTIDNMLNYVDSIVEKYVAVHEEGEASANCHAMQKSGSDGTYINRVQCIAGKLYYGIKYRAGLNYDISKNYVSEKLGDLHAAILLVITNAYGSHQQ